MKAPGGLAALASRGDRLRLIVWVLAVQALFWGVALVVRPSAPDPVFERNRIVDILLEQPDASLIEPRRDDHMMFAQGREGTFVARMKIDQPDEGW